jgi:hypothetical protein
VTSKPGFRGYDPEVIALESAPDHGLEVVKRAWPRLSPDVRRALLESIVSEVEWLDAGAGILFPDPLQADDSDPSADL